MKEERGTKAGIGLGARGALALVAWAVTCALAYAGVGGYVAELVEGMDPALIPVLLPALAGVSLLVSLGLTVRWARALGRPGSGDDIAPAGLSRRRFLAGAAGVMGGAAALGGSVFARISGWASVTSPALSPEVVKTDPNPRREWAGARVKGYRRFGNMDLRVSDIGLGTGQITRHPDPVGLIREALDRGVTYIDTSPDYAGTKAESAIGEALVGRRDEVVLATKFCTTDGHLREGASVATYVEVVEASLRRMKTDWLDVALVHSCDSLARLQDPNLFEAFERLKERGLVRHLGMSTHTPNLEEVTEAAIADERFEMLMLAYHHGAWPRLADLIDRAAARGMAVVAMKTLKGAKHHGLAEFRGEADAYSQAAFKWVLANPSVSSLVVSFFDSRQVDEYLYASGAAPTERDVALLERYDELIAGTHCFAHCGACLDACPEHLAIHDVLRHRMYFEDYGDQKQAMELYAKLSKQADICIGCAAPCTGACPHGIPIQERTTGAHELLTLA